MIAYPEKFYFEIFKSRAAFYIVLVIQMTAMSIFITNELWNINSCDIVLCTSNIVKYFYTFDIYKHYHFVLNFILKTFKRNLYSKCFHLFWIESGNDDIQITYWNHFWTLIPMEMLPVHIHLYCKWTFRLDQYIFEHSYTDKKCLSIFLLISMEKSQNIKRYFKNMLTWRKMRSRASAS